MTHDTEGESCIMWAVLQPSCALKMSATCIQDSPGTAGGMRRTLTLADMGCMADGYESCGSASLGTPVQQSRYLRPYCSPSWCCGTSIHSQPTVCWLAGCMLRTCCGWSSSMAPRQPKPAPAKVHLNRPLTLSKLHPCLPNFPETPSSGPSSCSPACLAHACLAAPPTCARAAGTTCGTCCA